MSEKDYTCDIRELSTERMYVSFVKNYADQFLPLHASRNINNLKDGLLLKIGTYYEEDLILRLRSHCRSKDAEIQKLQAENEKLLLFIKTDHNLRCGHCDFGSDIEGNKCAMCRGTGNNFEVRKLLQELKEDKKK